MTSPSPAATSTIQLIWDSLASVPDVIWSGVIGAVIALIGVILVNKSNTTRLRDQLRHDAEQKEKDRLAALRKDVYLQAPKEAMKAIAYISKLASRDLAAIGDDEGISGYAAVAGQIAVLSELPTVEAVNALGNTLTHALLDTMRELQGVQDTRVDVNLKQQRLDAVTSEIKRIQAEQQKMSELGERDPVRVASLKYWLDTRMEESDELRGALSTLRAKHQRLLYEYHKVSLERMPVITGDNIRVMRAVRRELGLTHELDAFEAEMHAKADALRTKLLEMMQGWAEAMEAGDDD